MNQTDNELVFNEKKFSWRDGKRWFDCGVVFFKQIKNYWYVACLLIGVLMMAAGQLSPVLMAIVMVVVSPFITAFTMKLCHTTASKTKISVNQIWQLIMSRASALLILGGLSALLSLIFQQIQIMLLGLYQLPIELTEEMVMQMTGSEAFLRAIINIMTNVPVAMALSFSPALILFNQTAPATAMKRSVIGVVRAWKAFFALVLLFILMFFGVMLLASLIMSVLMAVLGANSEAIVQIVVMFFVITVAGVGLCAQYQAFVDIFKTQADETETPSSEIYTEI